MREVRESAATERGEGLTLARAAVISFPLLVSVGATAEKCQDGYSHVGSL